MIINKDKQKKIALKIVNDYGWQTCDQCFNSVEYRIEGIERSFAENWFCCAAPVVRICDVRGKVIKRVPCLIRRFRHPRKCPFFKFDSQNINAEPMILENVDSKEWNKNDD